MTLLAFMVGVTGLNAVRENTRQVRRGILGWLALEMKRQQEKGTVKRRGCRSKRHGFLMFLLRYQFFEIQFAHRKQKDPSSN